MARASKVDLSEAQRAVLDGWTRNKAGTSYRLIERARIVLMSADGLSVAHQARCLGVDRRRIDRWRTRWEDSRERLALAERQGASARDLSTLIEAVLADEKRPGAPATFTAEQLTQIIAVACEPPGDSGRPVTHWTPRELADEVIGRAIVPTISPRHIDRILKGGLSVRTRASTG